LVVGAGEFPSGEGISGAVGAVGAGAAVAEAGALVSVEGISGAVVGGEEAAGADGVTEPDAFAGADTVGVAAGGAEELAAAGWFGFGAGSSKGIGDSTSLKVLATSSARSVGPNEQGAKRNRHARRVVRMRMKAPR
jgi:hypothetical protein